MFEVDWWLWLQILAGCVAVGLTYLMLLGAWVDHHKKRKEENHKNTPSA